MSFLSHQQTNSNSTAFACSSTWSLFCSGNLLRTSTLTSLSWELTGEAADYYHVISFHKVHNISNYLLNGHCYPLWGNPELYMHILTMFLLQLEFKGGKNATKRWGMNKEMEEHILKANVLSSVWDEGLCYGNLLKQSAEHSAVRTTLNGRILKTFIFFKQKCY